MQLPAQTQMLSNGNFSLNNTSWTKQGDFDYGTAYSTCYVCPGYAYAAGPTGSPKPNLDGYLEYSANLTIPTSATSATLSFYSNATINGSTTGLERIFVYLYDYTTSTTFSVVTIYFPGTTSYTPYSYSIPTTGPNNLCGHQLKLGFHAVGSTTPTTIRLDEVSLSYTSPSCTSPTASVNSPTGMGSATMVCTASGGSGGAINYEWHSGTSCTGTVLGTSSTLPVSTSGAYTCRAYIANNYNTCFACATGYATITSPNPCTPPTASVNSPTGNGSVTMVCTATGGSGGTIGYEWYAGSNCTGPIQGTGPTLSVSTSGYYSCRAFINNYYTTCNVCAYGYATVNSSGSAPVASFTVSPQTIFAGNSVSVNNVTTGGATSWSWSAPGSTTPSVSVQSPGGFTYNTAGTYTITLIASNSFGSSTDSKTVTVTPVGSTLYTIIATDNPSGAGVVTGSGQYVSGSTATLNAQPKTSWKFLSWTENGVVLSTTTPLPLTVSSSRTILANFVPDIASGPDLTVILPKVIPNTTNAGNTVTASFALDNDGTTTAVPNTIGFYLCTSQAINSGTKLKTQYYQYTLGANSNSPTVSVPLYIPANTPTGTYFVAIFVDDDNANPNELNEGNNVVFVPIEVKAISGSCPIINGWDLYSQTTYNGTKKSLCEKEGYPALGSVLCGESCLKMVLKHFKATDDYDMDALLDRIKSAYGNYFCDGSSSDVLASAFKLATHSTMKATSFKHYTEAQLKDQLCKGLPVIIRVHAHMDYANKNNAVGHFMVATGLTNDSIYVMDPFATNGLGYQKSYSIQDFRTAWDSKNDAADLQNAGVIFEPAGGHGGDSLSFPEYFHMIVYPNPSSGIIYVAFDASSSNQSGQIEILNLVGQKIKTITPDFSNVNVIDLSSQANGYYFIKYAADDGRNETVQKIVLIK